jgi:hypothetical protein
MIRLLISIAIAFIATASNCGDNPQPTPSSPDGPQQPATCAMACARAAALKCDYAAPSPPTSTHPQGVPCTLVCLNAQNFSKWDLVCRTAIKTCADVLNCQ